MPFRKAKIRAACEGFFRQRLAVAAPIEAASLGLRGTSYWKRGMTARSVYVVVTSDKVYMIDTTTMSGIRPKKLFFSEPCSAITIRDVRREFDPSPLHLWTTVVRYALIGGRP